MTRAELKSAAKEQIKGNIATLLVISLIPIIITALCNFIPVAGAIVSFLITPVFSLAITAIYIKLTNKERIAVVDVFSKFNQTGKALWLNILIAIYTFLWSLLFVIPGLVKTIAYSMSYYVLADNPELTASEAIKKSNELMNGHKSELFVLSFSFFWWYLLVSLTFGIASIYVVPYYNATIANFYKSIKDEDAIQVA